MHDFGANLGQKKKPLESVFWPPLFPGPLKILKFEGVI